MLVTVRYIGLLKASHLTTLRLFHDYPLGETMTVPEAVTTIPAGTLRLFQELSRLTEPVTGCHQLTAGQAQGIQIGRQGRQHLERQIPDTQGRRWRCSRIDRDADPVQMIAG